MALRAGPQGRDAACLGFRPSLRTFTAWRVSLLVATAISLLALVRLHVGLAWSASVFARPFASGGSTGPVILAGQASGTPVVLESGDAVLGAVVEGWDRRPGARGARRLCRSVVFGGMSIDGRALDWHPDAVTATAPGERALFGDPRGVVHFVELTRPGRPLPTSRLERHCDADARKNVQVVQVHVLLPGDAVTVAGCAGADAVRPCGDGRDLLSSRDVAGATRALRMGEAPFLVAAWLLGCPSLFLLVLFFSRHAASLSARRRAAA